MGEIVERAKFITHSTYIQNDSLMNTAQFTEKKKKPLTNAVLKLTQF